MARTVLLIDYYPRSISRIRTVLQSSGYRVVVAHDADEGVKEFGKCEPDLTLIQDLLPKGHGYELCRELKESGHGQRTPVILLTAPRSGGRRHELLQTRCDDFVEKPFTDDGLLAAVRKILPDSEMTPAIPAAAAQSATQPASSLAAPATAPAAAPIPFELTADDIGAALDTILPGPRKKKEDAQEPATVKDAAAEEPENGKGRSLKNILKRKRKPRRGTEPAATSKGAAKRKRKTARKTKARKASGTDASGKKVPAPA
jgi:CheY-like chemotaxis protein